MIHATRTHFGSRLMLVNKQATIIKRVRNKWLLTDACTQTRNRKSNVFETQGCRPMPVHKQGTTNQPWLNEGYRLMLVLTQGITITRV